MCGQLDEVELIDSSTIIKDIRFAIKKDNTTVMLNYIMNLMGIVKIKIR